MDSPNELRLPPYYLNDPANEGPEEDLILPTFQDIQDQTKPAISSEIEWPVESSQDSTASPLPSIPFQDSSSPDISFSPLPEVEPSPEVPSAPELSPEEETGLAAYEPPIPSGGPGLIEPTLPDFFTDDKEPAPDLPEPTMQTGGSTDTPVMPAEEEIEKAPEPSFPEEVEQGGGLAVESQSGQKEEEEQREPVSYQTPEPEAEFPASEEEPTAPASDSFTAMLDRLRGMSDSLDQLVKSSHERERDSFTGQGIPRFVLPTRYDQ